MQPTATSSEDAPLVGKRVLISGLLARPDLNGRVGEVVSFAADTGRYAVDINGEQLALNESGSISTRFFVMQGHLSRLRSRTLIPQPSWRGSPWSAAPFCAPS